MHNEFLVRGRFWGLGFARWNRWMVLLGCFGAFGLGQAQEIGFSGSDLGDPVLAGLHEIVEGGVNVVGGGLEIGSRADEGYFYSEPKQGDFDVHVRVTSLEFVDVWTKAGLMVRESLEGGSAQVSVTATPSISGISFQSRDSTGATARSSGNRRVNYPNTWLRLKREGNQFSGFSSFDGIHWTLVGSHEGALSEDVQLGLVVSSHSTEQSAIAQFRDYGHGDIGFSGALPSDVESSGPSSRRTGLTFSEIMYHPMSREDGLELEFIELMNTDAVPIEISGYRLSGSIDYVFPDEFFIGAGRVLVVAKAVDDFTSVYGEAQVLGGFEGSLPNGRGELRLQDRQGAVLLETRYESEFPWPVSPDGSGHSLVLSRPSYGEGNAQAWSASAWVDGSPGGIEPVRIGGENALVINEFLANSEPPVVDFVELYNHSNEAIDLGGMSLSDDPELSKFRFEEGTMIEARGYRVVDETVLGFALNSGGEQLFLRNKDGRRVLDAVRFAGQRLNVSSGRYPDGKPGLNSLSESTPGGKNTQQRIDDVVINEIMFHPISGLNDDEYIELHNKGTRTVSLDGWQLDGGIRYDFASGTSISPGGYLVIARNAARLIANYEQLTSENTLGDYRGTLGNGGDQITLLRPEGPLASLGDGLYVLVDEVNYRDGGTWGKWSDGGGSSLELRDANSDNRYGNSWADSDESSKSDWVTIERTALLEQGSGNMDDFQIFLQGAGECLIDDVEFIDENGQNFIANGGFDDDRANWFFQGNHDLTLVESAGEGEAESVLHLSATGRGDNGANRVRYRFRRPFIQAQTVATIRARVRWLRGHSEILLRPKGNYMELAGTLSIPTNLGSPGLKNGQAVSNAGPVIFDVAHFPVLPREGEPVLITARVEDSQGLASVLVDYRLDPEEEIFERPMRDDGTAGDLVAGDGVYSTLVEGRAQGEVLAFAVRATDAAATESASRFPHGALTRECLITFGEQQPFGNFGTYRIWLAGETVREWTRRLKLHNGDLDATFVYGNQRVVYNAGTLYSGSPFVSPGYTGPTGALCGYVLHLPKDDQVLGAADFVLDWPIRDPSLQLEQVAFWMAEQMDVPYLRRRNINLYVNGAKRGRLYEDIQQPSRDVADQFYPDSSGGDLYKIEDWFEFSSSGTRVSNVDANLLNYVDAEGQKFVPRYRYNWRKRAVNGSTHDFSSLFELVDAMNLPRSQGYTETVDALVDVEGWMGAFAVEHIVGNWDSYGYRRGKNMYAYKPEDGKWALHIWDMDFALGASTDGPRTSMFSTIEPVIQQMYSNPPFRRIYYQAMQKAVEGPLRAEKSTPVLQANFDALIENGIRPASIRGGQNYIATRLDYLKGQIANVNPRFEILSNGGAQFSSQENLVTLRGTAPIQMHSLTVNDIPYPIRWTTESQWETDVLLTAGENTLRLRGFSRSGDFLRGALDTIRVEFTGEAETAADHLVINEIMFRPATVGGEYVEILNTAQRTAFSLEGYRLSGIGFEFPADGIILPGEHLVIVSDTSGHIAAYEESSQIIGEYRGRLNPTGETLRLLQMIDENQPGIVIDEVTYAAENPWPLLAVGQGSSLQLIDPARDNDRIANWGAVGEPVGGQAWKFASVTGVATSSDLMVFLSDNPATVEFDGIEGFWTGFVQVETDRDDIGFRFDRQADGSLVPFLLDGGEAVPFDAVTVDGREVLITWMPDQVEIRLEATLAEDGLSMEGTLVQIVPEFGRIEGLFGLSRDFPGGNVYLDDVSLVAGSEAEVGANLVANGSFESDLAEAWRLSSNHAESAIVEDFQHTGAKSLQVSAGVGGFNPDSAIIQTIKGLTIGEVYTLSFRYLKGSGGRGLSLGLDDFSLLKTVDIAPARVITTRYTPGFENSNSASLPAFPTLRINEIQTVNPFGPADSFGDLDPWLEIYNSGSEGIDLSDFYLGAALEVPGGWKFPEGATIEAGEHRIVWMDQESSESSREEWHSTLDLAMEQGSLSLSQGAEDTMVLVDFVRYGEIVDGESLGLFPSGAANTLQPFMTPSQGALNVHQAPELDVLISEWMALNNETIADPADPEGDEFDDWFELYNAGETIAELGGLYFSDDPMNPTKYAIPRNISLAPGATLLIWADEQTEQNDGSRDLHVNFKLSQNGETIGLYTAGGEAIDLVIFGEQAPDVSEGRSVVGDRETILTFTVPSPGEANQAIGPEILNVSISGDNVVMLQFTGQPGNRYQVQYRDDLSQSEWQPLGAVIVADDVTSDVVDASVTGVFQRFYSVILIE